MAARRLCIIRLLHNQPYGHVFCSPNPIQTRCRGRKRIRARFATCPRVHAGGPDWPGHLAVMEPADGGLETGDRRIMLGIHELWLFVLSGLLLNVTPGPDTAYII